MSVIPFNTWVGALNFFVLQWFGFRLGQAFTRDTKNGPWRREAWVWIGPVLPLSGWWTRYIGRP